MDGVTILRTYEAIVGYTWGRTWFGLIFVISAILVLILGIYGLIKEKDAIFIDVIVVAAIIGLLSLPLFSCGKQVTEIQHDVYLHGEINMDEFVEKYRIIEQDGLVFTITEKETVEGE